MKVFVCSCKTCGYNHPSGIEMDYHYMFHRDHSCDKATDLWRKSTAWHPRLSQVVRDVLHDNACIWLNNELIELENEEIRTKQEKELLLMSQSLLDIKLHIAGRI